MDANATKPHFIGFWLDRLGSGGSERVITCLASELAQKGYHVRLYLHHEDGEYMDELNPLIEKIILKNTWRGKAILQQIQALYNFFIIMRTNKNDIMMTSGYSFNAALVMLRFISRSKSKIVIRETSTFSQAIQNQKTLFSKIITRLARRLYLYADLLICPSNGARQDLIQILPSLNDRIAVIGNPVDFELMEKEKQYSLPDHLKINENFILGVGRLISIKGFDQLIEAWANISTNKNLDLVILGEGPERQKLLEQVKKLGLSEQFHMPGFDGNPYKYMSKAQLFVLTSHYEGLPNALIQALSCGCPAVSYNCPSGPQEILNQEHLGTLVPLFDKDKLINSIDLELSKPRNEKQRIESMRRYDKENIAEQYIRCFKSLFT